MLNRSVIASLSLCVLGLSAMGCSKETTSSSNIKTGGIAALIDVYADANENATVHVKLVVGGSSSNTYVNLEGKDELKATVNKVTKTLTSRDAGIYEANFSGVGEDTEFNVVLERPDDTTADDNSGSLPAPFELDEPLGKQSRAMDPLEITWTPESSDEMNLTFEGDCIFTLDKEVADTGSYTVKAGALEPTHDGDKDEACSVDLEASRSRSGSADSRFDPESYFHLHQVRNTSFVSNP
jgi:hypothetical protein